MFLNCFKFGFGTAAILKLRRLKTHCNDTVVIIEYLKVKLII